MSGLETLLPLIYYEKQQPGSQLCAQHALNAILQGDYFSTPDLAQFAQQLDTLGSFNDAGPLSNNVDDTGFFSVQVLERALRVWGFTLVRWRSQDLRNQQDHPHSQMAFILNHQQHWFTLRRFGSLDNPESGHWFNLNSFLKEPEWVGKLYLGMVLSRAEDEGYSVFAVLPASEAGDALRTLPHTEADDIASTLPEPTSAHMGIRLSTSRAAIAEASSSKSPAPVSDFENEELELQAALQASLTSAGQPDYLALGQSASTSRTTSSFPTPPNRSPEVPGAEPDPVAASMARSKAIMQQMQLEQETALREGYNGEVAMGFGGTDGFGTRRTAERYETQTTGELEEAESIKRVIEESRTDGNGADDDLVDAIFQPSARHPIHPPIPASHPIVIGDRVYDDEDPELQAALKASLEGLLEGFVVPPTPPRGIASAAVPSLLDAVTSENDEEEEEEEKPAEIDAEEMRRRRLARFAG